jgi:hypothetical protein
MMKCIVCDHELAFGDLLVYLDAAGRAVSPTVVHALSQWEGA